ncbi:MAG: DUF3047 domain-containing protein [Bacillota bacterium]
MAVGDIAGPWRVLTLPRVQPAEIGIVADEGVNVLRVRSEAAAGSAAQSLHADGHSTLAWRWKIDRVVEKADLHVKSGDDFAARVYVFFDVPLDEVPFATRLKLKLLALIHGEPLPTAGICYVWDNRNAPGTAVWNPYTDRVRTVVLESGNAQAGRWKEERRDLASDFKAAFGPRAVPAVTGIAAGNDTDQTGETVTAWFGDFGLEPAR